MSVGTLKFLFITVQVCEAEVAQVYLGFNCFIMYSGKISTLSFFGQRRGCQSAINYFMLCNFLQNEDLQFF